MARAQENMDENNFAALERLACGLTPEKLRPLSGAMWKRWNAAKRGRPRKAAGTKAVPTLITVEPGLLRRIDAGAKRAGVSRSEFLAKAARRELRAVG